MAYYERWRSRKDTDEWFAELGFTERPIHGARLYFNNETGETLELYRPKQIYEKTVQHGIHLTEGILERLVELVKGNKFSAEDQKLLRKFILEEKNALNKMQKGLEVKENR